MSAHIRVYPHQHMHVHMDVQHRYTHIHMSVYIPIPHLPFRCHCLPLPSLLRSPDPIHPLLPTLDPTCTYENSRTLAQVDCLGLPFRLSLSLLSLPVSLCCLRSLYSFISKCTHRRMYDTYRHIQACIRALHPHTQANIKPTLTHHWDPSTTAPPSPPPFCIPAPRLSTSSPPPAVAFRPSTDFCTSL